MMKLRRFLWSVLWLLSGLYVPTSCIEEYEADIPSEDAELLVVEGAICSSRLNKFYLSRTQAVNANDSVRMVTGAAVSVRGTDGSLYPAQAEDGYYACLVDQLSPDAEYYLHIEVDGDIYESDPQKPLPTEKIADIKCVQNTPESDIDVLVTPAEPFDSKQPRYYSWTYDETWIVYPDYRTYLMYDIYEKAPVKAVDLFPFCGWVDATGTTIMVGASNNYDDHHIKDIKIYDIGNSDVRLYHRYSSLVHQRAITKAEYEYELARRQAGTEMGGLFTPLPSALPTNIHCLTSDKRVIGFVGCSLNTGDYRFFLTPADISFKYPPYEDKREWLINPSWRDCIRMVRSGYYLCEWIEPLNSPDHNLQTAWATLSQLDVRVKYEGAYLEEPDFWSLEENVSY